MYGSPFGQYPPNRILRILYYLPNFLRLFWRLFRDSRVSFFKKLIPIIGGLTSLTYLVFPFDLLPDPFVVLGQIDDAMVLMLIMAPSIWLFLRICPKELVKEHAHQISNGSKL